MLEVTKRSLPIFDSMLLRRRCSAFPASNGVLFQSKELLKFWQLRSKL